ncbi:TetR/AcrR family transcriptional regulator [Mangrovactinospora gilvigrisea]|uniref:TetR/AcrR family transcriptional regulator n=1 Tax=Mangrovactinospora gilvigrisea TaxID=1428644 RepID=UPI001FEB49D4|nr:TetR/AcrR family transcriptional regulator [Mangrovactinospora gilvigrisea]
MDAQRNLELVLRAAREVFGTLGYGAPMEEVAKRAGVGVGTVYRRFPSKDVLVRRIASEETARLAESAASALRDSADPWLALRGFLERAMSSGAGCLLPPELVERAGELAEAAGSESEPADSGPALAANGSGEIDELLTALDRLVRRARSAGALRVDATVPDLLLVLSVAAPRVGDESERNRTSDRILQIMLDGLRARPEDQR